jgi:hypothetical protein
LFLSVVFAATLVAAHPAAAADAGELKPASGRAMPFALRDLDGREHRLAAQLAGRPFAVLAVDYAEGPPRVREFADAQRVGFPLLLDRDGAVTKAWKVRTLPATYVIDADQGLRHLAVGALDWDSPDIVAIIEKLLPKR